MIDSYGNLSLVRRTAVHAVLGVPARLAIVEALALGDLSPSALLPVVEASSNLLAHHLNALAEVNLIARRPSQGDARRTYVTLNHAMVPFPISTATRRARRLVFVCTQSSARAPLAAALWREISAVPAVAAGTHPADSVHPRALAAARSRGLALAEAPVHLRDVTSGGDLVVTVCDRAHEELAGADDLHWSVPDPVERGRQTDFETAVRELSERVAILAPRVSPKKERIRS